MIPNSALPLETVEVQAASTSYKTTAPLNMRSSTSASSKIVKVLNKNTTVTPSKSKKVGKTTWYYLSYSGKKGWVSGSYLKKIATVNPIKETNKTFAMKKNVTSKTAAGSSKNASVFKSGEVVKASKYTTYNKKTWYYMTSDTKKGWVADSVIQTAPKVSTASGTLLNTKTVQLHSNVSEANKTTGTISTQGETFTISKKSKVGDTTWYYVKSGKLQGWSASTKFVTKPKMTNVTPKKYSITKSAKAYSFPGTAFKVTKTLKENAIVTVSKSAKVGNTTWYYVASVGWFNSSSSIPYKDNENISFEKPLVIGHRGDTDGGKLPEHSIASYTNAINNHADYIEMDLRMTKDNQIVVTHDNTVERTTDGTGKVSSFTLENLQKLKMSNGEHVLTLEEVFKEFGNNTKYYIETRLGDQNDLVMEEKLLKMIQEYDLEKNIIIQSFNEESLREIHSLNKDIPLVQLFNEKGMTSNQVQPDKIKEYAIAAGLDGRVMTQKMVDDLYDSKVDVHVWFSSYTEADLRYKTLQMGIQGIFTDYLDKTFSDIQSLLEDK